MWNKFFKLNDGNIFPNQMLITFFNRKFSNSKKKIDILDLGSGTGSFLMLIKKKNFYVDCVDISEEALLKLKKKYKNKNIQIFNSYFIDFLKSSKKKYDLIIDSCSLQHQNEYNLKKTFSYINSKLKKNGYFFSINLNSFKGINNTNFLVTRLYKKKLLKLFKLCKLKNVELNYIKYSEKNSTEYIKFNVINGQK